MKNECFCPVETVQDPARRLHDLPVAGALQLRDTWAAFRVRFQLLDMPEDPLHQCRRCKGILDGNIVGDGVQVVERRFSLDYLSHRAIRALAWALVRTRPSATAISPRAMPSSKAMRCCMDS